MGLVWNVQWRKAWAGKFPLSIKEWWALPRAVGTRKEESSCIPWAPNEHPQAVCHMVHSAGKQFPGTPGRAMWLGKYKQNWANFLTRLDLGGWVGKTRNGWMGWLEKQCQLKSAIHIWHLACQYSDFQLHVRNPWNKYNHLPTYNTCVTPSLQGISICPRSDPVCSFWVKLGLLLLSHNTSSLKLVCTDVREEFGPLCLIYKYIHKTNRFYLYMQSSKGD